MMTNKEIKTDLLSIVVNDEVREEPDHQFNREPNMKMVKGMSEPRLHYKLLTMPLTIKKGFAGSYWEFLKKCLKKDIPVIIHEIIKEWDWDGKYKLESINDLCGTLLPIDKGRKQLLLPQQEFSPTLYLEIGGDNE